MILRIRDSNFYETVSRNGNYYTRFFLEFSRGKRAILRARAIAKRKVDSTEELGISRVLRGPVGKKGYERNSSVPERHRHSGYSNHVCTRPGFAHRGIPSQCCVAWRKKQGERDSANSRNGIPRGRFIAFDSCLSESKRRFNPREPEGHGINRKLARTW